MCVCGGNPVVIIPLKLYHSFRNAVQLIQDGDIQMGSATSSKIKCLSFHSNPLGLFDDFSPS